MLIKKVGILFMKKIIALFLTFTGFAGSFHLQANTTLNIVGYINEPPPVVYLVLDAVNEPFDLSQSQTSLVVGTLNAFTDGSTYTISLESANLFKLEHIENSTYFVEYSFLVDGNATGTEFNNPVTFEHWANTNKNYSLAVAYTGVDAQTFLTGSYSDTITFTIAAQ
jgi:hypothetical protein